MVLNQPLTSATINTKNLQKIKNNIQKYSPHPQNVIIVGVTKTFCFSSIQSAEKNNIFNIGENKIQETEQKTHNKKLNPKTKLHLIGHLQSNKVLRAVGLYQTIQSVDSIKLLNKINTAAKKINKKQKIFLQINITKTPTQKGFNQTQTIEAARLATKHTNIKLCGVMSIGKKTLNQETLKKNFYETSQTQKKIQNKINPDCNSLSIGMSQDYVLALQAGATHLRLGTILFQKRDGN